MKPHLLTLLSAALLSIGIQTHAATNNKNNISVSPEERAKIEEVVREYLLRQPEILVQALQAFQQKEYQQAQQTVKDTQKNAPAFADALFHQTNDPVAGNPNGKITIVEFFDYQCPHCVHMAPVIAGIIKANPDVRIVFKELPIRGPISEFAARAALAANKQNKYTLLNHALLTTDQPLTEENILSIAKKTGLNVEQLKKDMNDSKTNEQIKANLKLAQELKLFGTPALFIGKTDANGSTTINYIPGQLSQQQLQEEIKRVQ